MNPARRTIAAGACAAAAGALGIVLLAPGAQASSSVTVKLQHIMIQPATVRIHRGTTVTWQWLDGASRTAHNVTSNSGLRFRSSPTKTTGTYSVRFTRTGTYRYECTIHPASMRGTIIVK